MAEGLTPPARTLAEIYADLCPMYMSFGMTYEQFWDGDPEMAVAYRKAYKNKQRQDNWRAWLNGRYILDAFSVAYAKAWSKNSDAAYPTKPYSIFEEDLIREKQEEDIAKMNKLFGYMQGRLARQKEAQENGRL